MRRISRLILCLIAIAGVFFLRPDTARTQEIQIKLDPNLGVENYSGRVYVFFTSGQSEPRNGPNWFRPEPLISLDVSNWTPEKTVTLTSETPGLLKFPRDIDFASLVGKSAQAVVRLNPWERTVGTGPGNAYSSVSKLAEDEVTSLTVDKIVPPVEVEKNDRVHVVELNSKLLSDFHQRPVSLIASVVVPENYDQNPNQRFPVIYEIPGFGGTYRYGWDRLLAPPTNTDGVSFIKVMLDPECPLGHHVFANSANNGPWGDALIEELIPEIDRRFRTDAREYGRFLTGHSSGGWSSLWLQVTYPEVFGGVWSTSPDPVDFRDFQRINLYQPGENMFTDKYGKRRPLARMKGQILIWYNDFSDMEEVLGPGGQLHSFEAVFSQRGEDGNPAPLWNRKTGEIDTSVAETWKKYDISLILKENWSDLGPHLNGKIHVLMGDVDNFYLEGATVLLDETLDGLGSDAEVTLFKGRDHMNLFQGGLHQRIEQQIADQYRKFQNQ